MRKQRDGVDASTPPKPAPHSRSATPPPVGASGGDAASTVGDGSTSTIAAALGGSRAWWPTRSSRRKGLLRDGGGGGVIATLEQRLVDRARDARRREPRRAQRDVREHLRVLTHEEGDLVVAVVAAVGALGKRVGRRVFGDECEHRGGTREARRVNESHRRRRRPRSRARAAALRAEQPVGEPRVDAALAQRKRRAASARPLARRDRADRRPIDKSTRRIGVFERQRARRGRAFGGAGGRRAHRDLERRGRERRVVAVVAERE